MSIVSEPPRPGLHPVTRQLRRLLPVGVRRWIVRRAARPRVGSVSFGDLRRVTPISRGWGTARGTAIDRRYIEAFLSRHEAVVRGAVLEFGASFYTDRFGGGRVSSAAVFDPDPSNPAATVVADLGRPESVPRERFDCIICTQTLHLIPDVSAGVRSLHQMLRPGGTLLITVPGICPVVWSERNWWPDYWRFTETATRWVLGQHFGDATVDLATYGNVLTATAYLYGLAAEELDSHELDPADPGYPMVIGARVEKV